MIAAATEFMKLSVPWIGDRTAAAQSSTASLWRVLAACVLTLSWAALARGADVKPVAIAIHGGAGVIDRVHMTPEREASYRAGLAAALDAGYAVLERGGSSLDAVVTAVRVMEDDPQFNAGRGAVLTHQGVAELDAAVMDGEGPRAGAVASVRHVKNPIELARLVMPVGAYTEFYWTVNARSLMNFVSLRAAETAQREIRRYAEACERFLAEKMPVTHAAFVENDRVAP